MRGVSIAFRLQTRTSSGPARDKALCDCVFAEKRRRLSVPILALAYYWPCFHDNTSMHYTCCVVIGSTEFNWLI